MKLFRRFLRGCVFVTASALFSGCIVSEQTRLEVLIDTNLTGRIVVGVQGVHSDSSDPEKQKAEFKEYCDGGYVKEGQSLASVFAIDAPQIVLTNKTEANCELKVEGTFDNVARALSAMAGNGDFEIKKSEGFLIARFFPRPPGASRGAGNTFSLVVQYAGEIQDHNAHRFDPDRHAMTWVDSRLDESGIQFILKLPEENRNATGANVP